jgi:hypothetical protein
MDQNFAKFSVYLALLHCNALQCQFQRKKVKKLKESSSNQKQFSYALSILLVFEQK